MYQRLQPCVLTCCPYRAGELLPHALCELLRGRPGRRAVGTFPCDIRAGIKAFWEQAAAAGLVWEEQPVTDEVGQYLVSNLK